MIIRELESGIRVVEERSVGATVADELKNNYPKVVGPPWNRKVVPEYDIPTPDLHYDGIGGLQISADKKHLVCKGWYDERVDLIRDDKVILSGGYQTISIESALERDFSRLAVISTDRNGKKAFHLIDEKGLRFTCLEGETNILLDRTTNGLTSFLLFTTDERENEMAAHFVDEIGNVRTALAGSEQIVLEEDSDGLYGLLSSVKGGIRTFTVFNWKGNEHLSFDVAGIKRYDHLNNFHLKQVLVFAETEEGGKIVQNGETLYEGALKPDFYASSLSSDGTFGAVTLYGSKLDGESNSNDNNYFIFCITPKGAFLYEQPFDKVMNVRAYSGSIVAKAIRGGVSRTVTVTGPQEQDIPQLTPDVQG